jgi:hypothetical protein
MLDITLQLQVVDKPPGYLACVDSSCSQFITPPVEINRISPLLQINNKFSISLGIIILMKCWRIQIVPSIFLINMPDCLAVSPSYICSWLQDDFRYKSIVILVDKDRCVLNIFITYLPLYPVDITHRIILSYSIVGIPTFYACVLIVTSQINVQLTSFVYRE